MPDEPRWRRYLRFWRSDIDADVDDELRFHLEMRVRDLMADGMSRDEAEAAAQTRFGDVNRVGATLRDHDRSRQRWQGRREVIAHLARDARVALRGLRRTPTFTVSAVLILAIGIGMAVAMFTVFRAVLVRPLPVVDQNRIVVLWTVNQNGVELTAGKQTVDAFRRDTRTLRDVAGVVHWGATHAPLDAGGRTILMRQAIVTGNFFDLLGVRPVLGRLLTRDDDDC